MNYINYTRTQYYTNKNNNNKKKKKNKYYTRSAVGVRVYGARWKPRRDGSYFGAWASRRGDGLVLTPPPRPPRQTLSGIFVMSLSSITPAPHVCVLIAARNAVRRGINTILSSSTYVHNRLLFPRKMLSAAQRSSFVGAIGHGFGPSVIFWRARSNRSGFRLHSIHALPCVYNVVYVILLAYYRNVV